MKDTVKLHMEELQDSLSDSPKISQTNYKVKETIEYNEECKFTLGHSKDLEEDKQISTTPTELKLILCVYLMIDIR